MTMTNRIRIYTALIFLLPFAVQAQLKHYTLAEATNGLATTLAQKSIKQASWQPETNRFYYVEKDEWRCFDVDRQKEETVISLKNFNRAVLQKDDSLKSLPAFTWYGKTGYYFRLGNDVYLQSVSENKQYKVTLPEKANNLFVSADGKNLAYTVANNVYWNHTPVSKDSDPGIVNGQSVHRDEFGIDKGIFISPRGRMLAYYKMDQTMVKDYPIINWGTTPALSSDIKYPMAGGTSHQVTLWVYNPATGQNIPMRTGFPLDQYLTCVTWAPDERSVYIALLNREQNFLTLNQYDVATGKKIRTLFTESHKKYVHPQHALYFIPGHDDEFIWWSQRDGFMHLYRYGNNGRLIRQLTKGDWVVNEILAFNKKTDELIIAASKESPMEKNTYAVNCYSGRMRRIDQSYGYHNALASTTGAYVFDAYSNASTPRVSELRSTFDKWYKTLLRSEDPLSVYARPEVREVTLHAADGTPLYGKLILPLSFDPAKKYPVIVYLYNGPNVQLLHNSYPASGNLWYEYMAQRGYVVFTMDGRGSSNRGLKFEQATHRRLGTVELEDQLKGVDYLKGLPYVDASRMGIHGWSFGGFMTTSMMLRYPDVFKAGVAGGPVMDWKMYEVMYTERYMGSPRNNPGGYETANLLSKVKQLKGKLLLIHGTDDDVVVWQHSVNFVRECVNNGVQVDYFMYPGHPHNVRGKDRIHLMQKITDYFDLYLKP